MPERNSISSHRKAVDGHDHLSQEIRVASTAYIRIREAHAFEKHFSFNIPSMVVYKGSTDGQHVANILTWPIHDRAHGIWITGSNPLTNSVTHSRVTSSVTLIENTHAYEVCSATINGNDVQSQLK